MILSSILLASALAALLVLHLEIRKGRVSFSEFSGKLLEVLKAPSSGLKPSDFEALVQKVNRIDREYEDWVLDAANALHKAELERTRVEQTIRRALERMAKGEDGQSALEALAEEHGIEDGGGGGEEEVLQLHAGLGVRSAHNWPGRAEALERRWQQ